MSSESIVKTNPPELHVPVDNLYTHVVSAHTGWVHRIGGQVPVDQAGVNVAPGDMAAQIREVYRQVTIALAAAGCTWAEVIHMDSYLAAERDIAPAYLGDHPPASTLIEVSRLVDRDWLVEVQVDAVGGTREGKHV